MKKTSKRLISFVLAVVLTLSVGVVGITSLNANASEVLNAGSIEEAIDMMNKSYDFFSKSSGTISSGKKDSKVYPTIIIPGISQSISYLADEDGYPAYNANGEELSGGLLILDSSTIVPTVANGLAAPLSRALINQNDKDKALQKAVKKTVKEIFSIQSSDKNGNPVNNLKTVSYKTSVAKMSQDDRDYFYRMIPMNTLTKDIVDVTTGKVSSKAILNDDSLYLYAFPLIGDPLESARGLNDYIQFVKKQQKVDKVNIVTISLGGTILTAYMDLYKSTGYKDINRIVNVVSCLQGTDVMGDFFLRKFKINDPEHPEYEEFFFNDFLPMVMQSNADSAALGYIINVALKIMPKEVVYSILTGAVDGIVEALLHNCPQFWAMIPTDRYDEVKAKYKEIWTDPSYKVLAKKLDRFQTARVNLTKNLKAFASKGKLVHNVACYDLSYAEQDYNFFGAMRSSDVTNSDGIIDIDSTTLGTTYAKAGSVLPDEIVFDDSRIISPDGSIDASTCAFPKTTWFFHGQYHEVGRNDVVISLIGRLITGQIKSVDDSEDFPQFNGNRNTRNIRRWRLEDAEALIKNYKNGTTVDIEGKTLKCSKADMDELKAAYKECLALLNDTAFCEPTAADAATKRIEDAIYRVGHNGELPEEDNSMDVLLTALAGTLEDVVTAIFGHGYGFSEIATKGIIAKK